MLTPLLEQARKLSLEDRRRLVEELWASIEAESDSGPLSAEERRILEERLAEHERNPDAVVSWESAKARILGSK